MDLFIRFVGFIFVVAGLPTFRFLAAMTGAVASLTKEGNERQAEGVFLVYMTCVVAGILSASGLALLALARIAYPIKKKLP